MLKLIQNDVGFDINFALKQNDGTTAFDLTLNTGLTFKMKLISSGTNKISAAITVDDAFNGLCHYTVLANDLDTVGGYEQEIQVTFAGKTITFKGETIKVSPDLP